MDNDASPSSESDDEMSIGQAILVYTVLGWLGAASAYTSYKLSYAVASRIAIWNSNRRFNKALNTLNNNGANEE